MNLIAIECSTNICSVASFKDACLVNVIESDNALSHSKNLPLMFKSIISDFNNLKEDIDYFAISIGPGSFTSLRISLSFVKGLEQKKPVIFCGDLNVAHKEIDLKNPKTNRRNPGFTDEERASFDNIVNAGFIDTFREFNTEEGHYTWWSYMFQARKKDIGWRIDYFCISESLKGCLKDAYILKDVMGSDHAPVVMEFND